MQLTGWSAPPSQFPPPIKHPPVVPPCIMTLLYDSSLAPGTSLAMNNDGFEEFAANDPPFLSPRHTTSHDAAWLYGVDLRLSADRIVSELLGRSGLDLGCGTQHAVDDAPVVAALQRYSGTSQPSVTHTHAMAPPAPDPTIRMAQPEPYYATQPIVPIPVRGVTAYAEPPAPYVPSARWVQSFDSIPSLVSTTSLSSSMQGYVQPSLTTAAHVAASMVPTVEPPFASPLLSASPAPTMASHGSTSLGSSLSPCTTPLWSEDATASFLSARTCSGPHWAPSAHSFPPLASIDDVDQARSIGRTSEHTVQYPATPSPVGHGGFGAQLSQVQTPGCQSLSPSPSLTTSVGGRNVGTPTLSSYQYYSSVPPLPLVHTFGRPSPSMTSLRSPYPSGQTTPVRTRTTRALSLESASTAATSSPSPASQFQLGGVPRIVGRQRGRKVTQGKSAKRPWECSACGLAFQRQEHANRHYRSRHGGGQRTYIHPFLLLTSWLKTGIRYDG